MQCEGWARTAKQWKSLLAEAVQSQPFRGLQDQTEQSPEQPDLIALLAVLEQVVRVG